MKHISKLRSTCDKHKLQRKKKLISPHKTPTTTTPAPKPTTPIALLAHALAAPAVLLALAAVALAAALSPLVPVVVSVAADGCSLLVLDVCSAAVPFALRPPVGVTTRVEVAVRSSVPVKMVASLATAVLGMRVKRVVVPSMTVVRTVVSSSSGASVCEVVAVPVRVMTSAVAGMMEPRAEVEVEEEEEDSSSSSSLRGSRARLRAEVRERRAARRRSRRSEGRCML
ncbi:hypothetical protein B0J12DRAFT_340613 [Macrophomina phaseolina]|uniref:Uncharacterized protein n=1 Tax=Macrophomina phaseolina TaxID=35725 RepID=A0ABQ8GLY1_9PEZI|nr:hypothetical protein B0J12DRAFT_340613 [Macrophomina phaseolina]